MDMFAQRTQGTYIERHESSLVWQYRDADPDYGEMQAKELEHQLADVLAPFSATTQILRGENPSRGGYVEVRPAGVDKGAFLKRLLVTLAAAARPADFALVVGDDESDEPMFRSLSAWTKQAQGDAAAAARISTAPDSFFSVCIGKKPSEAESYVDSHDNLLELLQALARVSNRVSRHYSSIDLVPFAAPGLPLGATPTLLEETVVNDEDRASVAMLRSFSMPVIAEPPPRRQPPRTHKVPSWMSFQEATGGSDEPSPDNPEDDDAAMFF